MISEQALHFLAWGFIFASISIPVGGAVIDWWRNRRQRTHVRSAGSRWTIRR